MKEIKEWEILTDSGFESFSGITTKEDRYLTVYLESGKEITGSINHWVFSTSGEWVALQHIMPQMQIATQDGFETVVSVSEISKEPKILYDLVAVESGEYLANGIVNSNCDEMAFIPSRIQEDFMASISPALSATKGKFIITSTPNGSRDLFSQIWFGTGLEWDNQLRDYVQKNVSKNDFKSLFVPFWIDPEKNTPEWISREKRTVIDEQKWKIEFECLGENTIVEVQDQFTSEIKQISLKHLFEDILYDAAEADVVIEKNDSEEGN